MGNRKEFELLFALNAQMNGGFSSTFSKAKAEFTKLGKEIQDLQKTQSNISAYQKQQQAIETTSAKVENLKRQQELLRTEIEEAQNAGKSTAALEREEAKLDLQIKDANAALDRQKQRLEATSEALRTAGVSTGNLEQESRKLAQQMDTLRARQEETANSAGTFGERSAQAFEVIGQAIAAAGISAALHEIMGAYQECIAAAGGFEASMSNVEALSGANAQEMAALSQEAKELGATTQFTAKQSADAMGYMAMAGWNASEMLSGMNGVMNAAAASGEDLALVADIITDSLSAFRLTAADTAHFSDVMAQAAASSNTSIAIMGETFKGAAAVAGTLGYSIEDVAVAVGLMANSNVKGSIAGTTLKNTFNGLLEGVTLTSEAFGEHEYSAVKADGTMKDFGSTIQELRGYFEQMTEAEQVENATLIAGQHGYNGLLAILNATAESYNSLTESINNCDGAAQWMAAIKMDNLNGDIALAESAWEGFQIAVGEKATPAMRLFYQAQAEVLSVMGDFVDTNPALVQGVMATAGVFGAAATAVTGLSAAVKVFQALDMASLFMGPAGVALKIGAAVAIATGSVVGLTSSYREQVPSVKELTEASREMQATLETGAETYENTMAETLAAANAADTYIRKLEAMGDASALSGTGAQEYHSTLALLAETIPELAGSIDLETDTIEGGTAALRKNAAAWQENAKAQAYQEYYAEMYRQEAGLLLEVEKNKVGLAKATAEQEDAERRLAMTQGRMVAANASGDYEEYRRLEASLDGITSEISLSEKAAANYQKAIADGEATLSEYREEAENTRQAIESLTGAAEDGTAVSGEAAAGVQELQSALDSAGESVAALTQRYNEAYTAALESITGQYSLWEEAAAVEETSASSMNRALESQISYWQQYDEHIDALTARSADIEGLSDMIASFADGTPESVNAIAGMAKANDEELRKMVENWQTLQTEQKTASDSLAQLVADFPNQVSELETQMETAVKEMNLSKEARESAEATIQAFIDGAAGKMGAVQSAYSSIAATARNALGAPVSNGYVSASSLTRRGFASGTSNAPPGWAWVGEDGPELMYMRGGETVLPADVSSRAAAFGSEPLPASGGGIQVSVNFSPTNQITAASSSGGLEALLQKMTAEENERFAERVLEVVTEYGRSNAMEVMR